jgi:aryl-alcohol dehydrogenase-like predicted oxidoreductase
MRRVRLGKTELMVTEVGLGGIPIVPLDQEDAVGVVRRGYDLGIRFFDTANAYRTSEGKMGEALESVRDDVVIATKTLAREPDKIRQHVQLSLDNLRTDRIDIYQIHNVSNEETLNQVLGTGGAYEVLADAQEAGKVKHIGVTSHNIDTAINACRTGRFETLQFPFNFVERDPAEELFQVALEMDVGIIGMKPLGGGWLEQARLCFGFLQQYPGVVPIPGVRSQDEIEEIVALHETPVTLTPADWQEIEKIRAELGTKFCHRCEYCLPCEQGVKIPRALGFPMFVKRFTAPNAVAMLKEAMESVENCTECGECLEKCPYNIAIPGGLKENLALYREYVPRGG